jgi:hypothetical protein
MECSAADGARATCPCARCSCDGACGDGCACGDACECKRRLQSGTTRHVIVGLDCSPNTVPMVRWLTAEIVRGGDVVQLVHVIPG